MYRLMLAATFAIGFPALAWADRTPEECFPVCMETSTAAIPPPEQPPAPATAAVVVPAEAVEAAPDCGSIAARSVQKIDQVNNDLKPIRELAGYIRSPQGLAFKLVNDHLVKIPPWVGFALDPVGTLKHKALNEVRSRARDALRAQTCPVDAPDPGASVDALS